MSFFSRAGWNVQFLEGALKTPLPRTFSFADPEKIRELARRGEAWGTSEYAIEQGRGGVYLHLTPLSQPSEEEKCDGEQQRCRGHRGFRWRVAGGPGLALETWGSSDRRG